MYKEKIDAYIDSKKEEMLADLCTLVRIDSQRTEAKEGMPYGEGPAKAVAAAEDMLRRYGFAVKNYDNRVVTGDFSDQEKALDILAHLDVVPVTEDWTVTQPFEPKIVEGRIYGRGTADDKGPAIAVLYAMRAIRELGIPIKKSVRIVLGSDEECGSSDLAYYYGIEEEAPYTFTPDADFPLINIEKGRFSKSFSAQYENNDALPKVVSMKSGAKVNVVPQVAEAVIAGLEKQVLADAAEKTEASTGVKFVIDEKEQNIYTIHARGQAAHASTPQEGKNALTATLQLLAELPIADSEGYRRLMGLHQMFPYSDTAGDALGIKRSEPQSGDLTMCFSVLNYTPTMISGEFDTRLPIGCTSENTAKPVEAAFAAHKLQLADVNISEPHCVPGDSWFVKTLLGSYERYSHVKGEPLSTGGGTYVHHLKRGVAFGCMTPDVDNHMHGDDEFMVIERLLTSAKIFADAILKICGYTK